MGTIGVAAPKPVPAAVALAAAGRALGRGRGPNRHRGWSDLRGWARHLGAPDAPRRWGLEGAWNSGRGLAQELVAQGEAVDEVTPRWPAAARRRARHPGTSDALAAHAAALLVWREGATLPRVGSEAQDEPAGATAVLARRTTEREAALAAAPRRRTQLPQLRLQLDPEDRPHRPALTSAAGRAAVERSTAARPRALDPQRAAAGRRRAPRLRLAVAQAEARAQPIRARARARVSPLTRLRGVQPLTAGALAGLLGPGRRLRTDAPLAASAGGAPLEAASAGAGRHRLTRGGTRRLHAVRHRSAVTQAGASPQARASRARRHAEGRSKREAVRARKRFLARALWRLWLECLAQRPAAPVPAAA